MQFITKLNRPISNPLSIMPVSKNHQAEKEQDFKDRKVEKTDQKAIKKNKMQENMLTAMPVENYKPLFKELHKQYPAKNYQLED